MNDNSLGYADYYQLDDYAGIGQRIAVQLIDVCVLIGLAIGLWLLFLLSMQMGLIRTDPSEVFWVVQLFVIWVYLGQVKRSVGTLGYRLLGLKIVRAKGGRPTLLAMTARMMLWIFGPFNVLLDLVWLAADSERQSLRDCYLSTYVVKRSAVPLGQGPVHLTRYNACGMTLGYPRVIRPE
ncbi:RDD family protein [Rhodopirellula sp. MGV]|uniref:RDD family protein n=1 Tax=Rhodopirellula sp. MGV TaxID=2023130 RepID=UPI001303F932|nr:RDD family protein [Rhodopirellula sp. MGV]